MIHNSFFKLHKPHRLFFYLLIVLLPTQLGYHFWPEWSHVLGRRIDYLSPTLYLTDILILLTLASWLVEVGFRRVNYELGIMNLAKKYTFFILASLCILLFIYINIATSLSPSLSIYTWLKFLEFGLLGLYIVKTRPSVLTIQKSLFIAVLYSSVIAIVQFYLQHSIGGPLWFLGERTFSAATPGIAQIPVFLEIGDWKLDLGLMLRAYGTFPHPNVLGGFLAITLPLLISVIASETKQSLQRLPQIFYGLAITMGTLALFLTFSRSAWIVGGIGILYSVYRIVYSRNTASEHMTRNTQFTILFVLLTVIIGLSLSVLLFPSVADESVIVRLALNVSAISIWKDHVWFGVGLGNFITALPSFLPSNFIYFLQPVHNIYLLVLSETGIFGFCVFILFIWKSVAWLVFGIWGKKELANFPYSHDMLPYVMLLLLGLVDHYPLTVQQGQLLFVVCVSYGALFKKSA